MNEIEIDGLYKFKDINIPFNHILANKIIVKYITYIKTDLAHSKPCIVYENVVNKAIEVIDVDVFDKFYEKVNIYGN